jgi:hypothetical protein
MQYKNTIEAVYIHLDEIQQSVARIGVEGDIRAIDVDLTLDKLRDVYDLLLSLRNESGAIKDIPKVESKVMPKAPDISVVEDVIEETEETIELSVEEQIVEKESPKPEIRDEPTQAEKNSRVRTSSDRKNLGESFSSGKPILNEELSQSNPLTDVSSRFKTKPISSIGSAIGLNEKFELIQNLFDGDSLKYNHTMDVLNMSTDFNEAFEYLNSNFNWDMNDPLVVRILELIRRKLIVKKNE